MLRGSISLKKFGSKIVVLDELDAVVWVWDMVFLVDGVRFDMVCDVG